MPDVLPSREPLPRYVAPLPERLESFGLRWAWLVVAINLAGTAFGFWYYVPQLSATKSVLVWPLVPDSPMATLFIAASLALWKLGRSREWVNMLAFFGCLVLGLWTPYVLLAFRSGFSSLPWYMYNFLFWSHLAMVVEAFLIHRYSEFPVRAIAVAVGWFTLNVVVDYFLPIVGTPHHTLVPGQTFAGTTTRGTFLGQPTFDGTITHVFPQHNVAAAGAVVVVVLATFLAFSTRVAKLETRLSG